MKTVTVGILSAYWLVVLSGEVYAQEVPTPATDEPEKESTWQKDFNLGVGLSFTVDIGDHDRVKEAELVDGIVRVTDEENGIPRLVLEGHYFFGEKRDSNGNRVSKSSPYFGHGPFVAIQPGDEEIINAAAIGYMIGFRNDPKSNRSWNIGLGLVADPNVKVLGDGIEENQPLPGNETEIRFRETTQYGVILVFSTAWGL